MILLVDDDKGILETYIQLLTHAGFQVSAHICPQQAFKQFQANPEIYQTVLTDYNMPIMDGLELIASIHTIRPSLKAILYSGMLPTRIPDHIIAFSKPMGIQQLVEVLKAN
ncbi:MAG: response regulator [Mariprofundaceae bacterium]|nr:response regulator [Mariprofundaceae bacterium]